MVTPVKQEYIIYQSPNFINYKIKCIINSGAQMNIIILAALKGHLRVKSETKKHLENKLTQRQ